MMAPLHLLDTDIASFIIKARSPEVEARLAAVPPDRVCVSAVTRAELIYGLKRLLPTHRLHIVDPIGFAGSRKEAEVPTVFLGVPA